MLNPLAHDELHDIDWGNSLLLEHDHDFYKRRLMYVILSDIL